MGYGLVDAYATVQKASCWVNIHNETVNTNRPQVNGCVIDVQNTTITNTGTLDLNATEKVIIGPGFTVQSGATFIIR